MRSIAKKSSAHIAMIFMVGKPDKNFSSILGLERIVQQVGPSCFAEAAV